MARWIFRPNTMVPPETPRQLPARLPFALLRIGSKIRDAFSRWISDLQQRSAPKPDEPNGEVIDDHIFTIG